MAIRKEVLTAARSHRRCIDARAGRRAGRGTRAALDRVLLWTARQEGTAWDQPLLRALADVNSAGSGPPA